MFCSPIRRPIKHDVPYQMVTLYGRSPCYSHCTNLKWFDKFEILSPSVFKYPFKLYDYITLRFMQAYFLWNLHKKAFFLHLYLYECVLSCMCFQFYFIFKFLFQIITEFFLWFSHILLLPFTYLIHVNNTFQEINIQIEMCHQLPMTLWNDNKLVLRGNMKINPRIVDVIFT